MKTYWKAKFSNYTLKKWIIDLSEGQNIEKAISNYLHRQNKGEAKSDRIQYKEKQKITHEEFNNLGVEWIEETF